MQRSKSFRPQEHCGQVTFYNDLYKVLTNIPFHMQNLGPVWKVFVLARMGVDIPVAGVKSILQAQVHWEDIGAQKTSFTRGTHVPSSFN